MKKKIIWTLVVLVVLSVIGGIVMRGRAVTPPESVLPTRADVATTVSINATYTPENYAHISAETPTKIAWVGVAVGDTVTQGQQLVRLDRASINAQIRSAQLAVERAVLAEQEGRLKSSNLSAKQILSLKKASEQARQQLNQIYAMSTKANLTAPIDGIVTAVNARVGEVVGGTLVRIIDPTSLSVEAFVSETDIVSMHVGQEAVIEFDALDNMLFDTKISHIDPEAISIQDVVYFRTLFDVTHSTTDIRPGMTGDLDIIIAQKDNALTLPLRFTRRDDTGQYVYIENPQKPGDYIKKYVTTGIESDDGLVEIVDGLDEQTTVYVIYDEK